MKHGQEPEFMGVAWDRDTTRYGTTRYRQSRAPKSEPVMWPASEVLAVAFAYTLMFIGAAIVALMWLG